MTTVKDLLENEELMNDITEDLDDFPEDAEVTYEVWAIGYDENGQTTDAEMLLGTFDDPDFAASYAKAITFEDVMEIVGENDYDGFDGNVQSISIEVETVIDEGEETVNVGTVYCKSIDVFEDLPKYITLSNKDYELLEDGSIKIPCELLNDYNKNDYITVIFEDDNTSAPMVYKIISKLTSNHFICEFM